MTATAEAPIKHYSPYTDSTDDTLVELEFKLKVRVNPGALDNIVITDLTKSIAEALTDYHDEFGLFHVPKDESGYYPDEQDMTSVTCEFVSQSVLDLSVTVVAD